MNKYIGLIYGAICGFLNGLFGSGGGTVAVPAFEKTAQNLKSSRFVGSAHIRSQSCHGSCLPYKRQNRLYGGVGIHSFRTYRRSARSGIA